MMRHAGWQGTESLLETAATLVTFVKNEKHEAYQARLQKE